MDRRKTDRRVNELNPQEMFNFEGLVAMLWRRKLLIIAIMLLILIPGAAYILSKPAMYQATAIVMMEEPDNNLSDLTQAAGGAAAKIDNTTISTQISILGSPRLITETLQEVRGRKDISAAEIQEFYNNLAVVPVINTYVLTVGYISKDPEESAAIVNAHVQNYIDYRLENRKEQIDTINKWLDEQVAKLKEDSQEKGQAIQKFRGESGILLGEDAKNLIYQQISDLTEQLVPVETQKMALQSKVDSLKAEGARSTLPEIMQSNVIADLKLQMTSASQDLKALSAKYGPSHPDRRAAQKRVAQIQSDLGREISNIRKSIEIELGAVAKQEELLNTRLSDLNQQADQMQDQSITMEGLQGDLDANRKLLAAYMEKFQEVKTRMDLSNSDIQIIGKAEVPMGPSGPRKSLLLVVLFLLSFCAGTGAAMAVELLDLGIEDERDVKRVLNLKLLGVLPSTRKPLGAVAAKNRTAYGEELKRVYLALAARKGPQSILVTSARSGEGKTTVALSLAQYLASIKSRVIIVDADSHSPSIAKLAGADETPGYAELIAGATDLSKAIKRDSSSLAVIPAGDHGQHGTDILSSGAFPKMIEALKSQYDYVIVDSANALTSTDAEVMAGHVDNVIMVAQWHKTPKKILKKVAESLRAQAHDIPHVILTKRA